MHVSAFGHTDVGKKRQHNEDAYLVDADTGLFVVCDGMGGHAAGEVASARAVSVVQKTFQEGKAALDRLAEAASPENRAAATALMEKAVLGACADIYRMAQGDKSKRGMGTTFVGLTIAGEQGVIGHVGDSRVYLYRDGQVHQLTEDHTLVAAQIKSGTITKEEADSSPYRNVITRAVGIQESVQVDTLRVDLMPGDLFLLCSDGLHGYLRDEELAGLFGGAPPEKLPEKLVELANHRGGKDNITAIAVKLGGAGSEEADASARMEVLRQIPLFAHLTYKEQTALLAIATTRTFAADAEIVAQGTEGRDLFVVVRGRVVVEKDGVKIAELKRGGHFGEMGLVDDAPRSATVRALEPTRVMVLPRSEVMALMRKEPVLAVKLLWSFLQELSARLRATNADLSTARQELAAVEAHPPFVEEEP